jgi:TonB family protein
VFPAPQFSPFDASRTAHGNSRDADRQIRHSMRPTDLPDAIDLAFDKTELLKDGRDEPPPPVAVFADIVEVTRLDPTRVDLCPETTPPKRSAWRGPIGSLLLHVLPLLALISWFRPPLDIPTPIPVQLVIEQPPPPPPAEPQQQPAKPPPTGPRASDDFGKVGPPSPEKGAETASPAQGEPTPPATQTQTAPTPPAAQAQTAPTPPEPPPEPPVESAAAAPVAAPPPPRKLTPPKQQTAAMHLPKLEGLEFPLPLHPDRPQESASARFPGPTATRDEYCAYALHLTMEHIDLLPLSLLGARRGDTTVTIRVRVDGTIINARVVQGSGYLDVDERVAAMVRAVKQFPPLPMWLPGPTADFTFHMHFPNGAER